MFAVQVLSNGISRPAHENWNVERDAASTGSSNNQIARIFPSPLEGIFTAVSPANLTNSGASQ